jgi:hypothetical protein
MKLSERIQGLQPDVSRAVLIAADELEEALTKRVAELESELRIAWEDDPAVNELQLEVAVLKDNLGIARKVIDDLQSQLAWTPVEKGLPTEPGVYEFLLNANCVTVDSVDIWRLDTELQSCTEWYWKDHDWFESPLKVGGYRWFRRIELPEAT